MEHTVRRNRPRSRPPLALRCFVGLLGVATTLGCVAILLSDRAPGALEAVFGDTVVQISDRLDARQRADTALGENRPGSDAIVHIGIWGVVTILAGWALWSWWGLIFAGGSAIVSSTLVELAQGRYSTTRAVERTDVLANALGVAIGVVVCAASYLVWSTVAAMVRRAGGR